MKGLLFIFYAVFIIFASGCARKATHLPSEPQVTMRPNLPLALSLRKLIPWSADFPEAAVVTPLDPNHGMFITQDPLIRITRTQLKLFAGKEGTVAIVVNAQGKMLPRVLDLTATPKWIATQAAPQAALLCKDGSILLGGSEGMRRIDPTGKELVYSPEYCGYLLNGPEDLVWTFVPGLETAKLIDPQGQVKAAYPVSFRYEFVADPAGHLCFCARGDTTIQCLNAQGQSLPQPGFDLPTFANIISFSDDRLVYRLGGDLVIQRKGEPAESISLIRAGLTAAGLPFVAGLIDKQPTVWVAGKSAMTLKVPAQLLQGPMPVEIVAVTESQYWAKGDGKGLIFDAEGNWLETFDLTEESYMKRLFPVLWTLDGIAAFGDGPILLSCAGPSGIALLELQ